MRPKDQPETADAIRKQVLRTIRDYSMLGKGDKVLVAVSGGPDSVMLLHCLMELAPLFDLRLGIAHVHHGLRPAAADEEALGVAQLAKQHHLPFHLHRANLNKQLGSLEERARQARYAYLNEVADGHAYAKIALGHQADDNAEAVLLNLLRGSGTRGLAGIPPCRESRIIRPLLHLRRRQILRYLDHHNLDYARDLSNLDRRFRRNQVRHDLIPLLQTTYHADLVAVLNRMAALCRDEEDWFESYLQPVLDQATLAADSRQLSLSLPLLSAKHPALQRRLMRHALRHWLGDLRRIGANHIEDVRQLLDPGAKGIAVCLPGGIRAVRTGNALQFQAGVPSRHSKMETRNQEQVEVSLESREPLIIDLPQWGTGLRFCLIDNTAFSSLPADDRREVVFDVEHLSWPLTIRTFRPGDRLQPFGMQGRKKVKDLFIDLKVPRILRPSIPLLLSRTTILWVVGVRRSISAPVSAATRHVLQVTCNTPSPIGASRS